jgi:hypothetical protein
VDGPANRYVAEVPHRRSHRGQHPEDARLFGPAQLPRLRRAADEIVWLLGRGYPMASAVTFVGARHQLEARQRLALRRALASEPDAAARRSRAVDSAWGWAMAIDGFNLVITVEIALSGGLLLDGRDGAVRDLGGLGGSYHPVAETDAALARIFAALDDVRAGECRFLLDAPVSNSGLLRARLLASAAAAGRTVDVELVPDVDRRLAAADLVVSSDSGVLDRCPRWLNLGARIVDGIEPAWRVAL